MSSSSVCFAMGEVDSGDAFPPPNLYTSVCKKILRHQGANFDQAVKVGADFIHA